LHERTTAARQVLKLFPDWSDRQLADTCALSPRTIAKLRCDPVFASLRGDEQEVAGSDEQSPKAILKRVGKDGRRYPPQAKLLRAEIRRVLAQDDRASLRAVAARTGASPETVRSVRKSMAAEQQLMRPPLPLSLGGPHQDHCPSAWIQDTACSSTPCGRGFAEWFDEHRLERDDLQPMAEAVPVSRLYDVIDEACRRRAFWEAFSNELQSRVLRTSSAGS
jgi:hypothetical protein